MILDKVENIDKYDISKTEFTKIITHLTSAKMDTFTKGKAEIDKTSCYYIGLEYTTKEQSECLWEAHRKNIDIHVILEGEERVFINDISEMQETKAYDENGDYTLYDGVKEKEIILTKGMFLVLFPNEVHKTSVKNSEITTVHKLVYKVPL